MDLGRIRSHGTRTWQRIVATIGKLPGLDKEELIGWEEIERKLAPMGVNGHRRQFSS